MVLNMKEIGKITKQMEKENLLNLVDMFTKEVELTIKQMVLEYELMKMDISMKGFVILKIYYLKGIKDLRNGFGKEKWIDGSRYEGNYLKGKK